MEERERERSIEVSAFPNAYAFLECVSVRERSERACEVRLSVRRRAKGTNAEGIERERERERPPPLGAFEYARINA